MLIGLLGLVAALALTAVFAVAAVTKLADRAGTETAARAFGAPASVAAVLAIVLPIAELVVAVLLTAGDMRIAGAAGALVLLVLFSAAIATSLLRGRAPDCHCFGQLHSAPASWKTLVRNAGLAILAGTALTAGLVDETPSTVGWIGDLGSAGLVALTVSVALVTLAAAGAWAFLSLLRSYGKVLVRLDRLEHLLAGAGIEAEDEELGPLPEHGLAPGTTAPTFVAADVDGASVSLDDLLAPGLPLLLLFTGPGCGPCRALLPDVAAWQDEHGQRLTIAIANGGDREASLAEAQEHGLERVLADHDLAVNEAYEAGGTPSAVLIAPDGTIASFVAPGADWIAQLLDRALAGDGESEEQGLPVGSPVPELDLRGLDGEPVSVALVEETTLVLFWNPDCGFCSSMRDDLLAWEKHAPVDAPRLLVVSSGDEDSTRAEGFSSAVALDRDFAAGNAFEAGGTPMAVLVDPNGKIGSRLAAGANAVLELLGSRATGPSLESVKEGMAG